ncbi:NirD/YgiW/YdeI family stress tolerance protein [Roseicyclus marinus]|nr:NirD/YgiW/YdeI family stress tolerance protein [Roseicyclus marinus]
MALTAGAVLAETIAIGELRRGMMAVVEGNVERITDEDEFILADTTGEIRVYIGPNAMPVRPGDLVRVEGVVDDGLRMEIYADAITLADGRIVNLPRGY